MDEKRKFAESYARKTLIDASFTALGGFLLFSMVKAYTLQLFIVYLALYQIAFFMIIRWMQKQKQKKQALKMGENNK